jgi:diaminohydroxyphosphoribosylaminopyrimidine deaminase/5-amino-6-(5-phosphoribosylamino)uracil reductase
MEQTDLDQWHMRRALELAAQGQGRVEPNPLVGCVLARGAEVIAEGWHRAFGGPHAEVDALAVAGDRAAGATAYVTLEPCCHHGKTPPCTDALIVAGVRRLVAAMRDPFPAVAGRGAEQLAAAGIDVELGVLEAEARSLNAPYLKLVETGVPWVIAKWAMTLDGKIATRAGDSRWISNEVSRAWVHELRGRVDAIVVGSGTALRDDPLLTARPPGPRKAVRVVVDSQASLPLTSRLVETARDYPVIVAAAISAREENRRRLAEAGCEVLGLAAASSTGRLRELLSELGRRRMTNVLVEGGERLLGQFLDIGEVDEVHAFIAPKLVGGADAPSPIGGLGAALMADSRLFERVAWRQSGADLHVSGRFPRRASS